MDLLEIIRRISYIRTRAKLSARELSLRIGKNESYINRLEYRKNFEPSIAVINDIVEACDSSLTQFFYYNIEQFDTDKEVIELLRNVNDKKKKAVIDLLR